MAKSTLESLLLLLKLTDEERQSMAVHDNEIYADLEENRRSRMGKFISDREVPNKGILIALQKSWKAMGFHLTRIDDNIFQFKFESESDIARVLEEGPWCFDDHLFVI